MTVAAMAFWLVTSIYDIQFSGTRIYVKPTGPRGPEGVFTGDGAFRITEAAGPGKVGIVRAAYGDGRVILSGAYGVWSIPAQDADITVEKMFDEMAIPILRDGAAVGFLHAPGDASQPIRATTLDGAALWELPADPKGTLRMIDLPPIEFPLGGGNAVAFAQRFVTFARGGVARETASTLTRGIVDSGFETEYANRLSVVDETGAAIWERDAADGRAMWPAEDGAEIVYGDDSASLVRIDVRTGEVLGPYPIEMEGEWRVRPVVWRAPNAEARTLLVVFGAGVALYDPDAAAPRWHLDLVSAAYGLCAASAVRFHPNDEPALALLHSPAAGSDPPYYQLWIVDAQGTILYHEAAAADASALVAVPNEDGSEALWLVGGGLIKRFEVDERL